MMKPYRECPCLFEAIERCKAGGASDARQQDIDANIC
ncbi:hypothetical protein CGRA01v4_14591 [Colletotrichum graminicola]|nr:hypothetical protein CGRA01v4_14591 [Colletotrichum graminicola]